MKKYKTEDFNRIHNHLEKPDKAGWYVSTVTLGVITDLFKEPERISADNFRYFTGKYWKCYPRSSTCLMQNRFFFGLNHDPKGKKL